MLLTTIRQLFGSNNFSCREVWYVCLSQSHAQTLSAYACSHMSVICISHAKSLKNPSLGVTILIYDRHARWLYLTHTLKNCGNFATFQFDHSARPRSNWILDSLTINIMALGKRASRLREASPAAPDPNNDTAEVEAETPNEHEHALDPSTSERRYWRDPLTGVQREIWRPGMFILEARFLHKY